MEREMFLYYTFMPAVGFAVGWLLLHVIKLNNSHRKLKEWFYQLQERVDDIDYKEEDETNK